MGGIFTECRGLIETKVRLEGKYLKTKGQVRSKD